MNAPYERRNTLQEDNPDIQPIALRAWSEGDNSYLRALDVAAARIEQSPIDDPRIRDVAKTALFSIAFDDAKTGWDNLLRLDEDKTDIAVEDIPCTYGEGRPSDFVRLLAKYPALRSVGVGAYSHLGQWQDAHKFLDKPLRDDLDAAEDLATERGQYEEHYKIHSFNTDVAALSDDPDNYVHTRPMLIKRKKIARLHAHERYATVVKNFILVDVEHPELRSGSSDATQGIDVRKYLLRSERAARRATSGDGEYDYRAHSEVLKAIVKPHISTRNESAKPDWLIPVHTSYYVAQMSRISRHNLRRGSQN